MTSSTPDHAAPTERMPDTRRDDQPAVARDHFVLAPTDWLAGCSDRGQRHRINQDALALAAAPSSQNARTAVLAVSDGVSTSQGSEGSSLRATEAACGALLGDDSTLADGFAAAQSAVLNGGEPSEPIGTCTLIVAVIEQGLIRVGSTGDCRAYWIADDGRRVTLSVDDSMAQAQIEMGMSREQAEQSFQAHAITRWIGPDTPDASPRVRECRPEGAGWLVLSSDGLWNYASEPDQMAGVIGECATDSAADTARRMVDWANRAGGHDNITVALARIN